jgi:hypothetical protein
VPSKGKSGKLCTYVMERHRTRAARRTVGGGTRGAMRANALHSCLWAGHAAFCASRLEYLPTIMHTFPCPSASLMS